MQGMRVGAAPQGCDLFCGVSGQRSHGDAIHSSGIKRNDAAVCCPTRCIVTQSLMSNSSNNRNARAQNSAATALQDKLIALHTNPPLMTSNAHSILSTTTPAGL